MTNYPLTDDERDAICSLVGGTLDSMDDEDDAATISDRIMFLNILRRLGWGDIADEWEKADD